MLIFTRYIDESIDVTLEDGRLIKIKLIDIQRNRVRIGVHAPRSVVIDREEITARKAAEARGEANGNVA